MGALSAFALPIGTPERAFAASATQPPWEAPGYPGSRVLWIYREGTDAHGVPFRYNYRLPFWMPKTGLYRNGYFSLCAIMRDVDVDFASGDAYIDPKLLFALWEVQVRTALEGLGYRAIRLYSGFRTAETNASIPGAATKSFHLKGQAADYDQPGIAIATSYEIAAAQREQDYATGGSRCFSGLGRYTDHVHGDSRGYIASW